VVKGLPAGWGTCSRTVTLYSGAQTLMCWKDTIAVGLWPGKIIILNSITGIQTAILSGHTDFVRSLAFSPDGTSLVSGSDDKTVKLWDVQTGGVVKTFHGHTDWVHSVSISADYTTIASGSKDKTICLWDIQTEECHHVIEQQNQVAHVEFSPTDPQSLISVSGNKVWHWNINGHQTNPVYTGSCIAFSLDGTQLVSCHGQDIVVQNTSSWEIVAKFNVVDGEIDHCCFSPDGRLIAGSCGRIAHVWDSTGSHPHPIKTFGGHTRSITSLAFPSTPSLISSSIDGSVKFWEIGILQAEPQVAERETTSLTSAKIVSITLQTEDNIAISIDSERVVRIWDISTGLCKASIQTLAKNSQHEDFRLINGRLIYVWYIDNKVHLWDVEKGEHLQTVNATLDDDNKLEDFRISGDGSNVFFLCQKSIQAWSIQTGDASNVELEVCMFVRSLTVDSSRVWVHSPESKPQGWDFRAPGSQLSNPPLLLSNNPKLWNKHQSKIYDAVTGRAVFQLAGRLTKPIKSQWDGHYLVAGYRSGEVLILDFNHVHA